MAETSTDTAMPARPITRIARWIRAAVSLTVFFGFVLLIGVGGYLYLTRRDVPRLLVRTVARLVESRTDARLAFDSVQVGPGAGLCSPAFDITGVSVEFGNPANPARFSLGRLQWDGAEGAIEGLRFTAPGEQGTTVAELAEGSFRGGEYGARGFSVGGESPLSGLAIESVNVAPRSKGVTILGLTQTPEAASSGARIAVAEIGISPIRSEGQPAKLIVGEVIVRRVDFQSPLQQDTAPICERLAELFDPLNAVRNGVIGGQERIEAGLAGVRRWLRIILIASILGFFLLKLVPSWDAKKWWSRLALAAAPVALPSVIYFLGRSRESSLPLFCIGLVCAAMMAASLYFGAYRRFSRWYHKGAAVSLDLAGMIILPLFLLNGFAGAFGFSLPAGLSVEHTMVAEISADLETAACDGLNKVRIKNGELDITDVSVPFDSFLEGNPSLDVSRVVFRGPAGEQGPAVEIENPAGREVLQLPELSAAISNLNASLDLDQRSYRNIGARLQLSGVAESASVRESVRRVRFLRDRATEFSTAKFSASANLLGPRIDPPEGPSAPALEAGSVNITVDAAVGLDLIGCTLPVDAGLGIDTRDFKASASIERRGESVQVRDLRSTAGSRLTFRDGTANVTFGDRLSVNAGIRVIGVPSESSKIAVDNARFNVATPIGCSPSGTQIVKAILEEIGVHTANGLVAGVEKAIFSFDRQIGRPAGKLASVTEIHGVTLSATSNDAGAESPDAAWLNADFPYARFELAGTASGETLPRRVDGTLDALISRSASQPRQAGNLAFGADEPVRFSANLQAPEVDVPAQHNTFHQSIASGLPESTPLDFSVRAALGENGAPSRVVANLLSDWISFTTPNPSRHFELNEISNLTLTTHGKLNRLPLDEDLFHFDDLPPLCRESVDLDLNPFQVAASFNSDEAGPLVRISGNAGSEIRISLSTGGSLTEIVNSGLSIRTGPFERQTRKLSAPNARIEAVDFQISVNGIQPGGSAVSDPSLALQADIARTDQLFELSSRLTGGDGGTLADFELKRAGERYDFALRNEFDLSKLARASEPFLQPLQCDLSWITPEVRIRTLSGNAVLAGGELARADLNATLAAGSLFAIDLDAAPKTEGGKPPAHLRKIQFAVDSVNPLTIEARLAKAEGSSGDLNVKLKGDFPLKVDARGPSGEHHQATVELRTEAVAALRSYEPAPNPILERGRNVLSDLRRHFTGASRVFGPEQRADSRRPLELEWDLELNNSPAAKPFEIRKPAPGGGSGELRSALAIQKANITWSTTGEPEASHFETSGNIAAASKLHRDYLIVEADSSLALDFALDSQPGCRFNFQTPFAAAFRDHLEPASNGAASLWDAAAYDALWANYQPAFPTRSIDSLVNCRNVSTGGLSILQVALPANAPRIAIGHGDHLQVNFPFAGSLLFGRAGGLLQADLEWLDDRANVSAAGNLDLANFQAAALGRVAAPGHLPFVEDEFNAKFNFLARDVPIGRQGIQSPPPNPFAGFELPPFDLNLSLTRAYPNGDLPGILQATNRVNLNLMNQFLDKVLAGVRVAEPPTALRYQGLDLNLAVKNGIIQTEPLFLNLEGVRLYASEQVEIESKIRVRWKRENWALPPYRFSDFVSSVRRLTDE